MRGVTLRIYRPVGTVSDGAVLVVHGGGWVWGGLDEVDSFARSVCAATGRVTAAVRYRLAPEHRWPAALDDVCRAIEELRSRTTRASLAIVGLSAGGNLAVAASGRLRDTAHPVSAQVLVYPMLDPTLSSESAHRFALLPPLSRQRALWFWDQYRPAPTELPVIGMPRTYVVQAEVDVLRDEGLAYARQLQAAGVHVDSRVWPGMVHGFLTMAALVPDVCAAAIADIAAWIRTGTVTP